MSIAARTGLVCDAVTIAPALAAWSAILGAENVRTDFATISSYAANCSGSSVQSLAVLFPSTSLELRELVLIARKYEVPLYPISGGKNWGYGSKSPVTHFNVIVDLRRMNRICEFDRELAYVVLEPGVTQQQLFEFLQEQAPELWGDVTGASPQASVMANILERGFGLSPYGERALRFCGMEILLADGRVLNTGFGRFENAACRHLYRWGLGPYLDGIFTQSNLGIVTKIGIWLMPKERVTGVYVMEFDDDQHLARALPVLRDLKLRGLIPAPLHIANDLRVISVLQGYPYEEVGEQFPLSTEMIAKLRRRWGVSSWNVIGGVWGSRRMVNATVAELREALKPITRVRYYGGRLLSWVERTRWLARISFFRDAQSKLGILKLLNGVPSLSPLNGVYWRRRDRSGLVTRDPDLDNAGVIWVSPVFPATNHDFQRFIETTRAICDRYKFETNVAVSLIAERAVCATVGIFFDLGSRQETAQAKLCKHDLLTAYLAHGYVPYRVGSNLVESRELLFPEHQVFQQICQQIKQVLDPQQIIAPGRYGIGC